MCRPSTRRGTVPMPGIRWVADDFASANHVDTCLIGDHAYSLDEDEVLAVAMLVRHRSGSCTEVHGKGVQTRKHTREVLHSDVIRVVEQSPELIRNRISNRASGCAELIHGCCSNRWVGGRVADEGGWIDRACPRQVVGVQSSHPPSRSRSPSTSVSRWAEGQGAPGCHRDRTSRGRRSAGSRARRTHQGPEASIRRLAIELRRPLRRDRRRRPAATHVMHLAQEEQVGEFRTVHGCGPIAMPLT